MKMAMLCANGTGVFVPSELGNEVCNDFLPS